MHPGVNLYLKTPLTARQLPLVMQFHYYGDSKDLSVFVSCDYREPDEKHNQGSYSTVS